MRLYYTTDGEENTAQNNPALSLGGYKSSSPTMNDSFDNLFGEITLNTIKEGRDEYIALMLVNETSGDASNVVITFIVSEDSYAKYYVSGSAPSVDADDKQYIERIYNKNISPIYAEFVDVTEIDNLFVGNLGQGDMIGLWIKRELVLDFIKSDSNDIYSPDPNNSRRYIIRELSNQDSLKVTISWE